MCRQTTAAAWPLSPSCHWRRARNGNRRRETVKRPAFPADGAPSAPDGTGRPWWGAVGGDRELSARKALTMGLSWEQGRLPSSPFCAESHRSV